MGRERIGNVWPLPPEAVDESRTRWFEGGGVRVGVEHRELDGAQLARSYDDPDQADELARALARRAEPLVDGGVSLHVVGPDGHEYLRFDCFTEEPHYHYVHPPVGGAALVNHSVPLDEVANGEPLAWALGCLRHRLGPMLTEAGGAAVAGGLDPPAVLDLLDRVEAHARTVAPPQLA